MEDQLVDNLNLEDVMDAVRFLDRSIPEQVIEVPMISCSPCPFRVRIVEPQGVEQLVEVPTAPTYVKQITDTPVLGGGRRLQFFSWTEFNSVDRRANR